jgi:hypothetical protein
MYEDARLLKYLQSGTLTKTGGNPTPLEAVLMKILKKEKMNVK